MGNGWGDGKFCSSMTQSLYATTQYEVTHRVNSNLLMKYADFKNIKKAIYNIINHKYTTQTNECIIQYENRLSFKIIDCDYFETVIMLIAYGPYTIRHNSYS